MSLIISNQAQKILRAWIDERVRWLRLRAFEAGPRWYARYAAEVLQTIYAVETVAQDIGLDLDECWSAIPPDPTSPRKAWEYAIEPMSKEGLAEWLDGAWLTYPPDTSIPYATVLDACSGRAMGCLDEREKVSDQPLTAEAAERASK